MAIALAAYLSISIYRSGKNQGVAIATSSSPVKQAPLNSVNGIPSELGIPSLNISLPIINGAYDSQTGKWTLTNDKAQFATETSPPNNVTGKTFIYGHATPKIFKNLSKMKKGDIANIKTSNGYLFTYKFQFSYDTGPDDLSVMKQTSEPTLTIQTCSGFRFQNRVMYNFSFESVQKI